MSLEAKKFKKSILVATTAIIEQINLDPTDIKTTAQYALKAGISRKKLQATFRHLTGAGLQEYRLARRMDYASELLKAAEKPIKEIAIICQFKSQRAFTSAFKKVFDKTPKEYQDLYS